VIWVADVLGHGLALSAEDPRLMALARAAFPGTAFPPVARLRLRMDPARQGAVRVHAGMHRWLGWTGGAGGVVDCARWAAEVVVGPTALRDGVALRRQVIEAAALFLITPYDRVPVHAAALVLDGHALLLVGPPGTGKSTLAWAAAAAGLDVLAEDVAYVQAKPELLVHGLGRYVHLRWEVARRLRVPEIAARAARADSVEKVAVRILPSRMRTARPLGVVMLERGLETVLTPILPREAATQLTAAVPGGFGRFRAEMVELAPRLVATGAWRLSVTDAPETALPVVLQLFADLVRRGTS